MHRLHLALSQDMRDLFLDGVPILDALEIGASTATAARWHNCDQSSISRTYRRASEQLGLNFQKSNGQYQASGNLALLNSLREASQLRRLSSGGKLLQWLIHPELRLLQPLGSLQPAPKPPLACSWPRAQRLIELLTRRIVDLAVIPECLSAELSAMGQACTAVVSLNPNPEPGHPRLAAVLHQDLQQHPCIRQLLEQLGTILH